METIQSIGETLKVGMLVEFRPDKGCKGANLGESHDFEHGKAYLVEAVDSYDNCSRLSGKKVNLGPQRFILHKPGNRVSGFKFQVGDKVRCKSDWDREKMPGAGHKTDLEFTIAKITGGPDDACYWPGQHGNGVYEHALELVDAPIINQYQIY